MRITLSFARIIKIILFTVLISLTVRLTSIHHPQIEGKFTPTPGGVG